MNTFVNQNSGTNTLTFAERVLRVTLGTAFVGSIFTPAPMLGLEVVLPLIGSYAVVSGMTGTGILRSFLGDQSALYRGVQLALSIALIGTVFIANTEPLGLMAILPMAGIYSALAALLGHSPVNAVLQAAKVIPHIVSTSIQMDVGNTPNASHKTGPMSHVA
ncbi:MAG: hypothetical protein HY273_08195 [Gammaproteobacteria bacterium]|nr:hypothetical protein [Gammaproteobacteria bacterium]